MGQRASQCGWRPCFGCGCIGIPGGRGVKCVTATAQCEQRGRPATNRTGIIVSEFGEGRESVVVSAGMLAAQLEAFTRARPKRTISCCCLLSPKSPTFSLIAAANCPGLPAPWMQPFASEIAPSVPKRQFNPSNCQPAALPRTHIATSPHARNLPSSPFANCRYQHAPHLPRWVTPATRSST